LEIPSIPLEIVIHVELDTTSVANALDQAWYLDIDFSSLATPPEVISAVVREEYLERMVCARFPKANLPHVQADKIKVYGDPKRNAWIIHLPLTKTPSALPRIRKYCNKKEPIPLGDIWVSKKFCKVHPRFFYHPEMNAAEVAVHFESVIFCAIEEFFPYLIRKLRHRLLEGL